MLDLLLFDPTKASWRWDFTTGSLPAGSIFQRSSTGWRFNGAGALASVPSDTPRYDFDAATLAPHGLLFEMQSTNLLLQSQTLMTAPWATNSLTLTAASGTAPDGTNTLFKAVEGAVNTTHELLQQVSNTLSDTYYGISFFVKAGARSSVYLKLGASIGNYATAVFDLQNGVVGETFVGATSGTIFRTDIRALGSGLYRVQMISKCAGTTLFACCGLATAATGNTVNSSGSLQYAGDGSSHTFMWGGQLDSPGVGVTSYIPTIGASVTRSADQLVMPIAALSGFTAGAGGVWAATYRLHTVAPGGTNQNPAYVTDGFNNNVDMRAQSGTQGGPFIMGSLVRVGTYVLNLSGGPRANPFVRRRQAFGYGPSRGVIAHDGIFDVGAASAGGLPVGMTTVYLGSDGGSAQLNGSLENVAFYPGQRSDSFIVRASR